MTLASFPLLIKRWKRCHLHHINYENYSQLVDYLPKDEFESRLAILDHHIKTEYPHIWLDTLLFIVAILFVVATAVFSVIARAIDLAMWYPLLLLAVPIAIGFITTKRKNDHFEKLTKYYESLQNCLKEINSRDVTRQIKWQFRRLRDTDTPADFRLKRRLAFYNINFVIDIVQVNTESELVDVLPAYDTCAMDVVLDMGPAMEQVPGNISPYHSINSRQSPPAYEVSMEPPPPVYIR